MMPTRPLCWFMFAFHPHLLTRRYLGIAGGDSEEFESDWELAAQRELLLAEGALNTCRVLVVPLLENDIDADLEERTKRAFLDAGIPQEKVDEFYESFRRILCDDPNGGGEEYPASDDVFVWIN